MLRAAVDSDRAVVLPWRNHPDVRRVSLTTHEITPDEHAAWWAAATADPDRRVQIFEYDGAAAGVVTFDLRTAPASWGFYLDVAGLGPRLLPAWLRMEQQVVGYAFDELSLDRLGGETLASNTAVLSLHRRFGFRETRRYPRLIDGTLQDVVWTERGKA